jgi:hypothetical protein
MTTKRLYYDDAFAPGFTAQVLSCEPEGAAAPDRHWIGAGNY